MNYIKMLICYVYIMDNNEDELISFNDCQYFSTTNSLPLKANPSKSNHHPESESPDVSI